MSKSYKVSGGCVAKRKARIEHDCDDCGDVIQPGEEYYQLVLEHGFSGFITKHICEQCWQGRKLKA